MMQTALLECQKCSWPLPPESYQSGHAVHCSRCGSTHQVLAFPALYRPPQASQTGETVTMDGESSCFYHPQKKAVLHCDSCGRFLCPLCDIDFSGQHLCPSCIQAGRQKKKISKLETHRVLYDDMALTLSVLPLLVLPFSCITAPWAFWIVIRHWKTPTSIIQRSRIRFMLAMLFSGLTMLGWVIFLYYQFFRD